MQDDETVMVEILREGMKAHAVEISIEEQCERCGGCALIRSGHSVSPSVHIYKACPSCDGTGHKKDVLQKTQKRARRRKLPSAEEADRILAEEIKKF